MKENTLYDKKSLKTVVRKTADFPELAKDCVAFSNAQGGGICVIQFQIKLAHTTLHKSVKYMSESRQRFRIRIIIKEDK